MAPLEADDPVDLMLQEMQRSLPELGWQLDFDIESMPVSYNREGLHQNGGDIDWKINLNFEFLLMISETEPYGSIVCLPDGQNFSRERVTELSS